MHFIGNRAIILGDGSPAQQIDYDTGFTALSFFLPIFVLLIAFHVLGNSEEIEPSYIFILGLLTGIAVCGMHYVSQLALANHDCSYAWGYILGSAAIAVTASLVALGIFFRLREKWTDSWWKRVLCASVFAGAVSGMRWTAAAGTTYLFTGDRLTESESRLQTVVVCISLATGSCLLHLGIALMVTHRRRVQKSQAQQLVLASVYFDEENRLMVTTNGALPSEKIANRFEVKTFAEDEFDRSHSTFNWCFSASRNWTVVRDLLPLIQRNLRPQPSTRRRFIQRDILLSIDTETCSNSENLFEQLFCLASERLAIALCIPFERLGPLFEEPLETGTSRKEKYLMSSCKSRKFYCLLCRSGTEEKSDTHGVVRRGRYLLLTRKLTKQEASTFAAMGYRFGKSESLSETLARNLQIPREKMCSHLERMQSYCSRNYLPTTGLHLAAFICRPTIRKGFDVLVPKIMQNRLPMITLSDPDSSEAFVDMLTQYDEMLVQDILKLLAYDNTDTPSNKALRWQIYSAFVHLINMTGDRPRMMRAIFSAKGVNAPCRSGSGLDEQKTCILYTVRVMNYINAKSPREDLTYISLTSFDFQQQIDSQLMVDGAFAHSTRLKFRSFSETESESRRNVSVSIQTVSTAESVGRSIDDQRLTLQNPCRISQLDPVDNSIEMVQLSNKKYDFRVGRDKHSVSEDEGVLPSVHQGTPAEHNGLPDGPSTSGRSAGFDQGKFTSHFEQNKRGYVAKLFSLFKFESKELSKNRGSANFKHTQAGYW